MPFFSVCRPWLPKYANSGEGETITNFMEKHQVETDYIPVTLNQDNVTFHLDVLLNLKQVRRMSKGNGVTYCHRHLLLEQFHINVCQCTHGDSSEPEQQVLKERRGKRRRREEKEKKVTRAGIENTAAA